VVAGLSELVTKFVDPGRKERDVELIAPDDGLSAVEMGGFGEFVLRGVLVFSVEVIVLPVLVFSGVLLVVSGVLSDVLPGVVIFVEGLISVGELVTPDFVVGFVLEDCFEVMLAVVVMIGATGVDDDDCDLYVVVTVNGIITVMTIGQDGACEVDEYEEVELLEWVLVSDGVPY
jgi:hypothetical protein